MKSLLPARRCFPPFVRSTLLVILGSGPCAWNHATAQGQLLPPPGPPAPAMRTLTQAEPRTPLDPALGNSAAVLTTDAAYHFVILEPGSYFLTGNLEITRPNGIDIRAAEVSLDLMGFDIRRTSGALGNAIELDGIADGADIRNGSISLGSGALEFGIICMDDGTRAQSGSVDHVSVSGCSSLGVFVGQGWQLANCESSSNGSRGFLTDGNSTITSCRSSENGGTGIATTSGSVITDCVADRNGGGGFATASGCVLTQCSASQNDLAGILTGTGCNVTNSSANENGANGIETGSGSIVSGCSVNANTGVGILASAAGVTILDCNATVNSTDGMRGAQGSTIRGCTVRLNGDDGIEVPNDCFVRDNTCIQNGQTTTTGAGVHATVAGNRIEGNSAILNKRGFWIEGSSSLVIRNMARFNPDGTGAGDFMVGTNPHGPIVSVSGAGSLASVTNADHPMANFIP